MSTPLKYPATRQDIRDALAVLRVPLGYLVALTALVLLIVTAATGWGSVWWWIVLLLVGKVIKDAGVISALRIVVREHHGKDGQ